MALLVPRPRRVPQRTYRYPPPSPHDWGCDREEGKEGITGTGGGVRIRVLILMETLILILIGAVAAVVVVMVCSSSVVPTAAEGKPQLHRQLKLKICRRNTNQQQQQ